MTTKELINQYVTAHAENRWMDASELETLLTEFAEKLQEPASEDLRKAEMDWLRPQLDKSYANYGERKMMDLTHFDGYAMLDAVEFGAEWQREQMMKDAIESQVIITSGGILLSDLRIEDFDYADKAKILIVETYEQEDDNQ